MFSNVKRQIIYITEYEHRIVRSHPSKWRPPCSIAPLSFPNVNDHALASEPLVLRTHQICTSAHTHTHTGFLMHTGNANKHKNRNHMRATVPVWTAPLTCGGSVASQEHVWVRG